MESKLLAVIAVIVVVAAAGALIAGKGGSKAPQGGVTTTSPPPGGGAATTTSQAGGGGQAAVEGKWSGSYKGSRGSGEWTWVIKKTSEGSYTGCLMVTGSYPTNGWIPVTITVEGDKITVGTAGGNAVVFTGKISGSKASGEWRFTNGYDTGSWSGSRVGGAASLPCMGGGATTTTSQAGGGESTGTPGGSLACSVPPPASLREAYKSVMEAVKAVLGSNMECATSGIMEGKYLASYNVAGIDPSQIPSYAQKLQDELSARGWDNVTILGDQGRILLQAETRQGGQHVGVGIEFYVSDADTGVLIIGMEAITD